MCCYVYSPGKYVKVDYLSETISLKKDGSSEVVIDILITNKSDIELDQLIIIYPNKFMNVSVNEVFDFELIGDFEDITYTLADRNSPYNNLYRQPGCNITTDAPPPRLFTPPGADTPIKISQPSPLDTSIDKPYFGTISGLAELKFYKGLSNIEWDILTNLSFTIFTYSPSIPIKNNIPRWARWRFRSETSTYSDKYTGIKLLLRKAINQVSYAYQVYGPFDVLHKFKTILKSYQRDLPHSKEHQANPYHILAVSNLINTFFENGTESEGTKTIIPDLRLHVDPFEVGRELNNIVMNGDITVSGGLPNIIDKRQYYEWKSGNILKIDDKVSEDKLNEILDNIQDGDYRFMISYRAKPLYLWSLFIPWIGATIAFLAMLTGLINLYLNLRRN